MGREGIEPSVTHGMIIIRVLASDTPLLPNQVTALTRQTPLNKRESIGPPSILAFYERPFGILSEFPIMHPLSVALNPSP